MHRYISIGNVVTTEGENEGFLIDLGYAVRDGREGASGAGERTGTKVFLSIGSLRQGDSKKPQSFMDDLDNVLASLLDKHSLFRSCR